MSHEHLVQPLGADLDTPFDAVTVDMSEAEGSPETAFEVVLAELTHELPEVEEDRDIIETTGKDLIATYGLTPDFFDKANTLFFAAIAQRKGYGEQDGPLPDRTESFLRDAMIMLAWNKQRDFDRVKWEIDADAASKQPGQEKAAYEAFTDMAMTEQLQRAIDNGLGHDLQDKMPADHTKVPYDLHVLDIGFTVAGDRVWSEYDALGWEDAEKRRLAENAVAFREQGKMVTAGESAGWVTSLDGRKILALTKPVAAMLLAQNDEPGDSLDTLKHELAHVEADLELGGSEREVAYGSMIEEFRAVIASDDTAYDEIRYFVNNDLYITTGCALLHKIKEHMFDQEPSAFWTEVASEIGLQSTLELALLVPESFIKPGNSPVRARINEYIGGLDGFTKTLYEGNEADPELKAEMNERMKPLAAWFKSLSPEAVQQWRVSLGKKKQAFLTEQILARH